MDPSLREQLLGIFAETNSIAVVGASVDSSKPAHQTPRYLQRQGYRIPPVNPRGGELLGEAVARSLAELIPRADGRLVSVEEYEALIEA